MRLYAYHDSHSLFYRNPFGAVSCGQMITFRLQTRSVIPVEACYLRLWERDREKLIPLYPSTDEFPKRVISEGGEETVWFEAEYEAPSQPGLVWYYFRVQVGCQEFYYGENEDKLGGEGKLGEKEPPSYQLTVYRPMEIPEWYKQGVMYQIFVDRFYGAKIRGRRSEARDRSGCLTKGSDPLRRIFPLSRCRLRGRGVCPRKNALLHADWYDTPVYVKDEEGRVTHWDFFGGNLLGVIKKLSYLRELGISIIYFNPIFDAPSNHKYDTANYHRIDPMYGDEELFERLVKEAKGYGISIVLDGVFSHTGSDSIYFNRYGTYPTLGAYQSPDSPYFKWYQFKPGSLEYKSWWDIDTLPEVDELNPSFEQFLFDPEDGVIQKWMKKGIAGWRLDVADELPDKFIQQLRQTVKTINPEAVLIGEVWEDASHKLSYGKLREYFWGDELDATMNYPFREIFMGFLLGERDSDLVHQQVMTLYENYPRENFFGAMNLIGSHDRVRVLTLMGEAPAEEKLTETQRQTFRLPLPARQLAVRRLKMLSLIQMTFPGVPCVYYGDEAGLEGYSDPYNRGTYPWGREDPEILEWYKKIIRWRLEYEVLQSGDFQPFCLAPDIYGFQRSGRDEKVTVLINRHTTEAKEVSLPQDWQRNLLQSPLVVDLLSGETYEGLVSPTLHINPLSVRVLFSKQSQFSFPRHKFFRSCGVLLHISSLPSDRGLGDMGQGAYDFIDFLIDSGQSLWQVLPLNPVGLGNSPYQSDSAFAGNPLLISLELLLRDGLIKPDFLAGFKQRTDSAEKWRQAGLREAFKSFKARMIQVESPYLSRQNYLTFQAENREWLDDYALFQALKTHFGDAPWYDWEPEIARRDPVKLAEYSRRLAEEIEFYRFVQYTFFYQWQGIRQYASARGIKLIGDIPLFVAGDSCDIWVNPGFFLLDESGKPTKVAGVPPDYFSKTGQFWGNPVYDWAALASTDYSWWKQRIKFDLRRFDYIRIDHFRGLEAYWEIDAGEETAIKGRWIKGPGKRFFESLSAEFGELPFIAEDLGLITPEVEVLKRIFGFPGMKVLQFTALEDMSEQDPDFIYYSGTHDNDTLLSWYKTTGFTGAEKSDHAIMASEPGADHAGEEKQDALKRECRKLIEDFYLSQATWVITPMQDVLCLDTEARMNVPGTRVGNWEWKLNKGQLTTEVKTWLHALVKKAKRLPEQQT